jgi:hypothetical protein
MTLAESQRVVSEWATRRRKGERADGAFFGKLPPARSIALTMLIRRDRLTWSEAAIVPAIETALPALSAAWRLVDRFRCMARAEAGGFAGLDRQGDAQHAGTVRPRHCR